ncbi:MAG: hypothetical protein Q7T36_07615 [Fluviicoccus sp.]|uniref:hypothetical protein n=1 Tax=Fluviicoccus sp. TaxID=2003552 RepID=UPI00271DC091|nr:hypothetical protein [Fluviicoccus sp.]MDO8330320.1 hypothetical protein [Fluviicoccus sp.]
MKRIFVVIAVLTSLTACSKDPYAPYEQAFMQGCSQGGNSSQCECTFGKIKERFTPEELERFNDPRHMSQEFMEANMRAAMDCR